MARIIEFASLDDRKKRLEEARLRKIHDQEAFLASNLLTIDTAWQTVDAAESAKTVNEAYLAVGSLPNLLLVQQSDPRFVAPRDEKAFIPAAAIAPLLPLTSDIWADQEGTILVQNIQISEKIEVTPLKAVHMIYGGYLIYDIPGLLAVLPSIIDKLPKREQIKFRHLLYVKEETFFETMGMNEALGRLEFIEYMKAHEVNVRDRLCYHCAVAYSIWHTVFGMWYLL